MKINPSHPNISIHILIFSILISLHLQGAEKENLFNNEEFSLVVDHFLCSHDINA